MQKYCIRLHVMDEPIMSPADSNASDRSAPGPASIVDAAICTRKSIRAFLPDPVPRETIVEILRVASRAPSGTNTQPWKVHVLTGDAKERLSRAVLEIH